MMAQMFMLTAAVSVVSVSAAWYDGIDSVKVVSPSADVQGIVDDLFREMAVDPPGIKGIAFKGQFGPKRRALIFRRGDYGNLTIPVNFYTSIIGAGDVPDDVQVGAISANDTYPGSVKGGLENFWRSVEGLSTNQENITWAVSQAAPLRRIHIKGNLFLSQTWGDEVHYTSGGFMNQVAVDGTVHFGTQQQFFFRSCDFANLQYDGGRSFVFVGVKGAPDPSQTDDITPYISAVDAVPVAAEKPYIVEETGAWNVVVPSIDKQVPAGTSWKPSDADTIIPVSDFFVAREGDNETTIAAGIQGKRGLLLTPAIYYFASPLKIVDSNFVVLGLGMATLVTTSGLSALIVEAPGVRVAQILIEAGHNRTRDATAPMLDWKGDDGVGSDIFTRVGAFAYESPQHPSCLQTHADVHVMVPGSRLVLDNTWFWHADHDDCTPVNQAPASDSCYSGNGLYVAGDDVTVYGLAVEHTLGDLVDWQGERGLIFFFQSELPYHDTGFPGYVGYRVGYDVEKHTAYGVGIYQVFATYNLDAAMRVPPSVDLTNVFSWAITTGTNASLGKLICSTPGTDSCYQGSCDSNSCHLQHFPVSYPRSARGTLLVV